MTLRDLFESWWQTHCRHLPVEDPKEHAWWWFKRQHPVDEEEEDTEAET